MAKYYVAIASEERLAEVSTWALELSHLPESNHDRRRLILILRIMSSIELNGENFIKIRNCSSNRESINSY